MSEHDKHSNDGKDLRGIITRAWWQLEDEQEKIPKDRRPEAIFKGYK